MSVLLSKLGRGRDGGSYRGQSRQRNAETMAYLAEQNRKFQLFMGVVVEHLEQKVAVQQQAFETMATQAPLDLSGWSGRSGDSFAISPAEIQAMAVQDELEMPVTVSEVVEDSVAARKAERLLPKSMAGWEEESKVDDMAAAGELEAGQAATSGWPGDEMMPHDPFGAENSTVASETAGCLPEGMFESRGTVLAEAGPSSDRAYAPEPDDDHPGAGSALLAGWDDEAEDPAQMAAPVTVKSLATLSWPDVPETTGLAEASETQNPAPEMNIEAGREASETAESWKTLLRGDV